MHRAVERIAAGDPRVVDYQAFGDPQLVRSRGLFVAEGRLVVRRVIEDARLAIRSLLVNDAALADLGPLVDSVDPAVPIFVCATADFAGIAGFNIHRGCIALVQRPAPLTVAAVIARSTTAIVLEGVGNPDNIGGVFRNAAAFGAGAVVLSPTCADPLYRKAIRTSMGAALRVPFAVAGAWPAALTEIRAAGFTIVALTPHQPSVAIDEWAGRAGVAGRIALLAGSEGVGLSADAESIADVRVRIPIADAVDSLNLAVAVGIALSRIRRS